MKKSIEMFESGRYGYMAVMLLIHCCIGSIAGALSLHNGFPAMFASSVLLCIGANSALIAISPPKWCVGLFYLSLLGNITILLTNLILK